MNKHLLVIARYKCDKQNLFENFISPKNKEYALKHGFNYIEIKNDYALEIIRDNPTWWKFSIIKNFINDGKFKIGDIVTHFDADMAIVKDDYPYLTSKSFSYSIDNGNTHCMGNLSIKINEWSIDLINRILDDSFYESCKYFDHWQNFREQAAWYTLCGIQTHSDKSFFEIENYGWHSHVTPYTYYDIETLHKHVDIKGPEWNTTLLEEEQNDEISKSLQKYNIVKSFKNNTIIRHFAGGQPWSMEYLNK
jgi:hypothetical protein